MPAKTNKKKSYTLGTTSNLFDLTCPSGATCEVKRIGPTGLIAAGLIDNLDVLGQIVQSEHVDRVEGKGMTQAQQMKMLSENADGLQKAMELFDKVTIHVVNQPTLWPVPIPTEEDPEAERIEGRVYIDTVDDEDKMFIFQWVMGGTQDLAAFRKGIGEAMGDMAAEPAVQGTP